MFPLELRLGPFALNAHGVMTAAGIWVGWLLARREARRKGLGSKLFHRRPFGMDGILVAR